MSLSISTMATEIHDDLVAQFGTALDDSLLVKYSNALATAVVTRIQGDAVAEPGSFANSAGNLTGLGKVL